MKNMPEKQSWPGASRSLARNKRKTIRRAVEAVVDVRQNGFARWIYNGNRATIEPFYQLKLICQAAIRAILESRIPTKSSQRGAFNGVLTIFVGSKFSAVIQRLGVKFLIKQK